MLSSSRMLLKFFPLSSHHHNTFINGKEIQIATSLIKTIPCEKLRRLLADQTLKTINYHFLGPLRLDIWVVYRNLSPVCPEALYRTMTSFWSKVY